MCGDETRFTAEEAPSCDCSLPPLVVSTQTFLHTDRGTHSTQAVLQHRPGGEKRSNTAQSLPSETERETPLEEEQQQMNSVNSSEKQHKVNEKCASAF